MQLVYNIPGLFFYSPSDLSTLLHKQKPERVKNVLNLIKKLMASYRIDLFKQLNRFYSIVFSGQQDIRASHQALYVFLLNQNNRNKWSEWFKLPFDTGMTGSGIRSRKCYYRCLDDLQAWGLIKYEKGVNNWKAARISLTVLMEEKLQQQVPQCEPATEQLIFQQPEQLQGTEEGQNNFNQYSQAIIPLPEPVSGKIYKKVTLNLKQYTVNNWQTLKSETASRLFYVGKERITDLKIFFESKFPVLVPQLKKNYGADFYEKMMEDFSLKNIEQSWNDEKKLRDHFTNYLVHHSTNKNKTGKVKTNEKNKNESIDELRERYKTK